MYRTAPGFQENAFLHDKEIWKDLSQLFTFFIGYQVASRIDISERDSLKRHQHHRLGDYGTF